MPNDGEIVGFQTTPAETRFELTAELRQQRRAETARITEIAARLTSRFGAETAVGFLVFEILGRPHGDEDLCLYAQRLQQAPSAAPAIVEELLRRATSATGPDRPASRQF